MVSLLRHVPAHDLGSLGPRISTSLYLHKPLVNEAESVCRLTFHSLRKFNSRAFCLAFVFVSASAVLISLLPASVQMCKIQKKEEKKKKPSNVLNFGSHSRGAFFRASAERKHPVPGDGGPGAGYFL